MWAASFISGCVLSSSQSKAVEPGAVSQRVLLSLPLHQQQGLCLCVLIHFLSVLFKIIPLFLSLFQLVVLSGAQDLHDKLHQCRLAILLFPFFLFLLRPPNGRCTVLLCWGCKLKTLAWFLFAVTLSTPFYLRRIHLKPGYFEDDVKCRYSPLFVRRGCEK